MSDNSYKDWYSMSDESLLSQLGSFIKKNRLDQDKTQTEVATAAGVSRSTLSLLERGESVSLSTLIQILRVLDLLHVMDTFHIDQEISPIALAKLDKKKRQRVRKKSDDKTKSNGEN